MTKCYEQVQGLSSVLVELCMRTRICDCALQVSPVTVPTSKFQSKSCKGYQHEKSLKMSKNVMRCIYS